MNNHKPTSPTSMPPSYQQALGESADDDYKDCKSDGVPSDDKQMLLAAENNSTKQEVSHQVNPNTNPKQNVQMPPVVITNPPTTSINQAQETNRQDYYCNRCRTFTDVLISDNFTQCTYIWACVLCCFASPLFTCVPFCMNDLKETTIYCRRCQRPIDSIEKNRRQANNILTILLLIGFTVTVSILIWRYTSSSQ